MFLFLIKVQLDKVRVIGTSSISYTGVEKFGFTLACITISWIWFFSVGLMGRQVGRLNNSKGFITTVNKVSALIMWGTAIYLSFTLIT
jgi:L-lysine exporter family protein LysE/ArgO